MICPDTRKAIPICASNTGGFLLKSTPPTNWLHNVYGIAKSLLRITLETPTNKHRTTNKTRTKNQEPRTTTTTTTTTTTNNNNNNNKKKKKKKKQNIYIPHNQAPTKHHLPLEPLACATSIFLNISLNLASLIGGVGGMFIIT